MWWVAFISTATFMCLYRLNYESVESVVDALLTTALEELLMKSAETYIRYGISFRREDLRIFLKREN